MSSAENSTFETRIGTLVHASVTPCYSGQRDIGGSVVTKDGRIVLSVGPSDCWEEAVFKIVVSDDRGKSFRVTCDTPAISDVTYHTTGMLYDERNDILMAVYGETKGYRLFNERNSYESGVAPVSPDRFGHSKLMTARSVDGGETWQTFALYDYKKNGQEHVVCGGICGCGVADGDSILVPAMLISANKARNAMRWETPLLRFRNLNRDNTRESFEFENSFRMLATNDDRDMRYADETVYVRKLDGSGFLSFHRTGDGVPFRREHDNDHRPVADFTRVHTTGWDPRDYDPGKQGPMVVAFNGVRMPDGNLLLASRFYGTEHHRPGNIFMTSRDEGVTWDYRDDQIPCSLDPLLFYPCGLSGNPSMSYLPDASLVHTTSTGWTGDLVTDSGSIINVFRGLKIDVERSNGTTGTVSIDASDVVGIDPVYLGNVTGEERRDLEINDGRPDALALGNYSADRVRVVFTYKISGPDPFLQLAVTLANHRNSHRPIFTPTVPIPS